MVQKQDTRTQLLTVLPFQFMLLLNGIMLVSNMTYILSHQSFPVKFFHHLGNILLALQTGTLGFPFKYHLRLTKHFHI